MSGHVTRPQGVRAVLSAHDAHPLLPLSARPSGHPSPEHANTLL